jgi:hypothetical protein
VHKVIDTSSASWFRINANGARTVRYKVEKGTVATDWTPAPEDVDTDISNAQTTADGVKNDLANNYTKKTIPDTRNDNQSPEWYVTNFPSQVVTEFKLTSVLGLTGEEYCILTTTVPWSDFSGGYPKQTAKVGAKEYWRIGYYPTVWGSWNDALGTADAAQGTANTALTNAANAQNAADKAQEDIDNLSVGGRNLVLGTTKKFEVASSNDFVAVRKTTGYPLSPVITNDPKAFLLSLTEDKSLILSYEIYFPRVYKNTTQTYSRTGVYTQFAFTNTTTGNQTYWYGHHAAATSATSKHSWSVSSVDSLKSLETTEHGIVGRYCCYTHVGRSQALQDFYANPDNYTVSTP